MLNKLLLLTKKYKNDNGSDVMSDPLFFCGIKSVYFSRYILAQKCGHFSVRFSNLNIVSFNRTFLS